MAWNETETRMERIWKTPVKGRNWDDRLYMEKVHEEQNRDNWDNERECTKDKNK